MKTANIEGQAEKVQALDSGLACGLLLITDRKREQELGKRLSEPRHYKNRRRYGENAQQLRSSPGWEKTAGLP